MEEYPEEDVNELVCSHGAKLLFLPTKKAKELKGGLMEKERI